MRIFGKGNVSSSPIVRFFGKGKCKFIANFSATMVTSLPSLSVSLSLSLSLSHRKYLTHNIGSASALPIIIGRRCLLSSSGPGHVSAHVLRRAGAAPTGIACCWESAPTPFGQAGTRLDPCRQPAPAVYPHTYVGKLAHHLQTMSNVDRVPWMRFYLTTRASLLSASGPGHVSARLLQRAAAAITSTTSY